MDASEDPKVQAAELDLEVKRLDLEDRRLKARRVSRLAAPLTPAALGLLAAGAGAWFQLTANRNLERDKFEYGILSKATEQPTNERRLSFLSFVYELGLIERRAPSVKNWLEGNKSVPRTTVPGDKSPGSGPPKVIVVSPAALRKIMPGIAADKSEVYARSLTAAMTANEITTPGRAAAFLANVAFVTRDLENLETNWTGTTAQLETEPPGADAAGLGNVQPGDGRRFRGRGLIHFGGRTNYGLVGKGIGLDLVADPDQMKKPPIACLAAGFWWKMKGLNELADGNGFVQIVEKVSGSQYGFELREGVRIRAVKAFSEEP